MATSICVRHKTPYEPYLTCKKKKMLLFAYFQTGKDKYPFLPLKRQDSKQKIAITWRNTFMKTERSGR